MTDTEADDRAAIHQLIAGYALALDAGDVDRCLRLVDADAEFAVYGRSFAGHDGIATIFRDVTARSQMLFVSAGDLHLRPALYDDELVRADERWFFRRRRCQFNTSHGLSDSPEDPPS